MKSLILGVNGVIDMETDNLTFEQQLKLREVIALEKQANKPTVIESLWKILLKCLGFVVLIVMIIFVIWAVTAYGYWLYEIGDGWLGVMVGFVLPLAIFGYFSEDSEEKEKRQRNEQTEVWNEVWDRETAIIGKADDYVDFNDFRKKCVALFITCAEAVQVKAKEQGVKVMIPITADEMDKQDELDKQIGKQG